MIYCDTSLIVAILTREAATDRVREWMSDIGDSLAISDWTLTEVASAFAMKARRGVISPDERTAIETEWLFFQAESLERLAIGRQHFQRAAKLVDAAPRGLRSGDALHLALTLDHSCELATLDRDLADAARAAGIAVHPARP